MTKLTRDPEISSLYVVELDQGTIKVGYSSQPETRVRSFVYQAAKFGIGVARHWVSDPKVTAFLFEKALIDRCAVRATSVHGDEWFRGLVFEEVKAHAIELLENDGQAAVA